MVLDAFRMDGRVAVVTGASRGIGAGAAVALAEAGADVVVGARSADALAEVAGTVEGLGRRAVAVAGDLSGRDGLEALVAAARDELGRLDVVVNNVGGSFPKPFLETSERSFEKALSWNVTTAFNLTQLAVPLMLEDDGGAVVNVASAAGRMAARGMAAYGTAKAAMIALTRNLAQDLTPAVRVNAVAPGAIATDALGLVLEDEPTRRTMVEGTPMRRLGEVDDISAAVLYLASPASSYVTGQVIAVDGGIQRPNLEMPLPDLSPGRGTQVASAPASPQDPGGP